MLNITEAVAEQALQRKPGTGEAMSGNSLFLAQRKVETTLPSISKRAEGPILWLNLGNLGKEEIGLL